MSQKLRADVLKAFKSLHRVRQSVFDGDQNALEKGRLKINDEYKRYKHLTNSESIHELIAHSKAVENELKMTVIQATEVEPGTYKVQLRDEVIKLDNVQYKDCSSTQ